MVLKALKDIAHITMGQSPESESYNDEKVGIPFFQGNADFGEIYPNNRIWCSSPKKIAEPGDILISVRAPIGALNYAKERCCIGRGLAAISIKDEAERNYVFHLLKAKNKELNSKGTGSTFKAIGKNVLEEVQVPQISTKEQQKRMSIMDYLESIIRKRREQLLFLDELIKARFVELFGDPVLNQFGWKKLRFDKICDNLDSRRKPITSSKRTEGIYPYYGASGIVDYVDDYIFDEDILLISEDGANLLIRSTPIAFSVSGKVWVNNHAHVVRFDDMSMQKYVEVFFSLIDISDSITGSAQPKLNQSKLNAMLIPIPEKTMLNDFLNFLKQLDKSKVAVQKALDEAQLLFDSLMQEYFG